MDIEPEYQAALDYLYKFVDFSLQKSFRYSPEKFDLGRMRRLMTALGNPEGSYPIIHIAGTKGKGSVAALCASALQEAGYRTGLYISPHLQDYVERIQMDGRPMAHATLVELVDELKPTIESIPELTTFEITTALAFLHFKRQEASAAVIEVGLGGRLDATNVCLPLVTVITSISYDHTDLLGDTLAQIAGEKGGIIKPGIPIVLAPQKDEAQLAIERIAAERGAPLILVGKDYLYAFQDHTLDNQTFMVWIAQDQARRGEHLAPGGIDQGEPVCLTIPLLGYHQVENAATAYAALRAAGGRGLPVGEEAIQRGFRRASWPGRFELLRLKPPVILDSAHNRDSALRLRLALEDYFPGYPVVLVYGASEDKDIRGMFAELLPGVRQVLATKSIHPRAADPENLAELALHFGRPAEAFPTVEEALERALHLADEDGAAILVTGSIFVVAAARQVWQARNLENRLQLP